MAQRRLLTQEDILGVLHSHHDALAKYKVKRIGLFGSFAKGHQKRGSDIDFLVEFHEPTFENFIGLVDYLEKTFGRNVDVLTPDGVAGIRIRGVAQDIRKSVVYA